MYTERLSAGKEVLSYCTKCRMDLLHVIIAMQGDRIVRVQCKTCRGDHVYKAPKGVKDPSMAPPPRSAGSATGEKKVPAARVAVETEWARLMKENAGKPLRDYAADQKFAVGDRLKHPLFGEGVVMKILFPKKVEICFSMDVKVLVHAG
jgi:hypothetical protein